MLLIVHMCLLVLFGPFSLAVEAQDKPGLFAVIVGVQKFQDSRIPPLSLAAKDAKDVYTFLKEREKLFARSKVSLFLNEDATRDHVSKALREDLKAAGKDDFVIIFFSGHGSDYQISPGKPVEYYYITYDTNPDNLYGTALRMDERAVFGGIHSERVFLITDGCHAGGYGPGLEQYTTMGMRPRDTDAQALPSILGSIKGRIGLLSSKPDEKSFEVPDKYGNGIFTHFLLKGLRGGSYASRDGKISARDLYDYVSKNTSDATDGRQHPVLTISKGSSVDTPVFPVQTYQEPLSLKVQFVCKDASQQGPVRTLTQGSILKSGDLVSCAFCPNCDCHVYIFWWDSSGDVGMLYPNQQLTSGTGEAKANQTCCVPVGPATGKRHWYQLDDKPGEETIYVVASREKNQKLESLYEKLRSMSVAGRAGLEGEALRNQMEKELDQIPPITRMGFARQSIPDEHPGNPGQVSPELAGAMENEIKLAGAEAVFKLTFKHEAR